MELLMRMEKDFKDFLLHLNEEHVNYCIVGGFSVIYHSRPRFTDDMDILIKPSLDNSKKVYKAIKNFGADISNIEPDYFDIPGHFYQIGIPPIQIYVINSVSGIGTDKVFKKKIKARYGGMPTYYIALDDLIKNKESVDRARDKLDVEVLKMVKEIRKEEKEMGSKGRKNVKKPKKQKEKKKAGKSKDKKKG